MKLAVISEKGKDKIEKIIKKNNDNFDIETFETFENFITFCTQRTVHFDRILLISEGVLEQDMGQLDARFRYFAEYVKTNQKATRVVLYHKRDGDNPEILNCFNTYFDSVIYSPMIVNNLTVSAVMKAVQLDIESISKQFGEGVANKSFDTSIDEVQANTNKSTPKKSKKKKKKGFSLFGGFGKKVDNSEEQQEEEEQEQDMVNSSENSEPESFEEFVADIDTPEVTFYNEEEMTEDTDENFDDFANFKVDMSGLSQNDNDNFNSENENSNDKENLSETEFFEDTDISNSSANDAESDIFDEFMSEDEGSSEISTNSESVESDIETPLSDIDTTNESEIGDVDDVIGSDGTVNEDEGVFDSPLNDSEDEEEDDTDFDIDSAFDTLDVSSESEARNSYHATEKPREIVKVEQVEKVVEKVVEIEKLVKVEKEVLPNGMTEDEARELVEQNRNELSNSTEGVLEDILRGDISEVFVFLGNSEISCKQSLELARYLASACDVLYIDLDTKYHPLLGYIDYREFKNQNKLRSVDVSKIKNVKSLLNYVVSIDDIDYISLDYGQDIMTKDLQVLQRLLSECILEYSMVIVNLPYNRVDYCKDLINDSIKIICIEQSIPSLSNAIISLEKDIRNKAIKMNIIRDVRYLLNIKNAEGDLNEVINITYERLSPTLSQFNWVDIQYTVYYEFDRTTLLELLDLVEG